MQRYFIFFLTNKEQIMLRSMIILASELRSNPPRFKNYETSTATRNDIIRIVQKVLIDIDIRDKSRGPFRLPLDFSGLTRVERSYLRPMSAQRRKIVFVIINRRTVDVSTCCVTRQHIEHSGVIVSPAKIDGPVITDKSSVVVKWALHWFWPTL